MKPGLRFGNIDLFETGGSVRPDGPGEIIVAVENKPAAVNLKGLVSHDHRFSIWIWLLTENRTGTAADQQDRQ